MENVKREKPCYDVTSGKSKIHLANLSYLIELKLLKLLNFTYGIFFKTTL